MISVIVPYRDAELWLGRCCESLHNNEGDFEFILVDDNSEDGGAEIVRQYQMIDDRFRHLINWNTEGVSGARNTGIDAARGEWITFLDADDEMMPGVYKTMTTAAKSGANMIQFNHLRYYTTRDKLVMKYTNEGGVYELPVLPAMWFGVWNKLIRMEFIRSIRFDESLQYGEDGLFILELLARDGRIHHAKKYETTVKHRFDNKMSLSRSKTLHDIVKQLNAYEQFLLRQEGKEIRTTVCLEMSRLWSKMAKTINK